MIYSSLISIPIILLFLIGTFFVGKYITESNEMFANNPFAGWVLGFIVNFGITFLMFFLFTWIEPSTIYFVIIFFVKEFVLYSFLIIRREKFISGINWKTLGWIVISGMIILFVYNYGISRYTTNDEYGKSKSLFNTWYLLKDSISYFGKVDDIFTSKWILGFISATVIYAIVASFFVEISKKHNHWVYLQALIMTLIIMTVMGIGIKMTDSIGYWLLPFMVLISMRVVMFSRRRYGAIFGITSFVSWSIDPKTLLAITILAFITTMVYTYKRKPRASLFWVQLVTPQLMLLSLELYRISVVLAIVIFILSSLLYIFMLRASRVQLLNKLNTFIDKRKALIPIVMLISMYIAATVTICLKDVSVSWFEMSTTKTVLYSNLEDSRISTYIQISLFAILFLFLIWRTYKIAKSNKPTLASELLIIFSLLSILFAYNPLVERMFQSTFIADYFLRMSYISIVPIFLLGASKIKKRI